MGDHITLRTSCGDNGEAIARLARDLDEGDLVLEADHAIALGSWVAFEVFLRDGQIFLEGMGRCAGSQARVGSHFIRLGDLQLDAAGEMLFERIQLAREDLEHGGRITGSIDISKLAELSEEVTTVGVTVPRESRSDVPVTTPSYRPPPPGVAPRPSTRPPVGRPPALPAARGVAPRPPAAGARSAGPSAARPPASPPRGPARPPTLPPPPAARAAAAMSPPSVRPPSMRPAPATAAVRLPPAPKVPTFAPAAPTAARATAQGYPAPSTRGASASSAREITPPRRDGYGAPAPDAEATRVDARAPRESELPTVLDHRVEALLPRLVAEGRVRSEAELRQLALRLGLDALEVVFPED